MTNNSYRRVAEHEAALAAIGIPAVGDVLSSAMAAALMVEPHERALVCGGPGVVEALTERGVRCTLADHDQPEHDQTDRDQLNHDQAGHDQASDDEAGHDQA
ncbi:MAG TPA: hypothetical protein PLV68_13840, partial [Ilumatobacteraceae bacterium]|nr:hypothetical protein [Ilumatobacteraceae bacterium]